MILNEMGQIVFDDFQESFNIRKELFLESFVLMPNHLHAIVTLDEKERRDDVDTHLNDQSVETHGRASLQSQIVTFHRKPKSISSFVAGFKSATINHIDDWIDANDLSIRKFNRNNPLWQANYYDHIIRNESEYRKISTYIVENPLKWDKDVLKCP